MMNLILIIIGSLLASVFFSGIEIAFIASDKLRIELDRSNFILNSGFFSRFIEKPGLFSATMMVGNLLGLIVFSFASAWLGYYLLHEILNLYLILIIQVIISTLIFILIAY
jgi:CBS domain containing-hemolysin-like protein